MSETLLLEEQILQDVHAKTGLTFRKIGGIDTRDPAVFAAVIPILADWVERLHDTSNRHAIYSRFLTPLARPYLDKMISWWKRENDQLAVGCLTQALTVATTCADAEQIWKVVKAFPKAPPFYYMLASKLANCPSVQREVREELIKALETKNLEAGDLSYIAKVKDPRVRKWFEARIDSSERAIRTLARRVTAQGRTMPHGVQYASVPPDSGSNIVVVHTECDIDEVMTVIGNAARQLGLKIPSAIRKGAFLSVADLNRWLVVPVSTKQGQPASMWFRMEDVDTVEVMILLGEGSGVASTSRRTEVLQ